MAVPVSAVGVCMLSLDLLKSDEVVSSIEEPESTVEDLCARWYPVIKRAVLRAYPWNFARKRDTFSRSGTPDNYADEYQLPLDYLGLVFIGEDMDSEYQTDFFVEGDKILIDNDGASSLQVAYIHDVEEVGDFDPIFLQLLVHELALVLSAKVTGLNKSTKKVTADRDRWEVKARSKNAQENPPRRRYVSILGNARRRGRRSSLSDGVHLF